MPKGRVSTAEAELHTLGHQKGATESEPIFLTMVTFWSSVCRYCLHYNLLMFPVAAMLASVEHHCRGCPLYPVPGLNFAVTVAFQSPHLFTLLY